MAYYGDYRPYFTIHDNEFKEYICKTVHLPNSIIGVTNPYFSKSLEHWPHIVKITDTPKIGKYIYFFCFIGKSFRLNIQFGFENRSKK